MLLVFDGNHYDGWSQFMTYHSPVGVIMTIVQHWLLCEGSYITEKTNICREKIFLKG